MITSKQSFLKRLFDVVLAVLLLPLLIVPILLLLLLATFDTRQSGLFSQRRIGQFGQPFNIHKIRTLKQGTHRLGHLELSASPFGKWLRRHKCDELPQLFNVLKGEMSFVGPRPDIPGFADTLRDEDRILLEVKPGITGPATLKYKNEDMLLAQRDDPEHFNRTVIWPDKVEINKKYVLNWSFYLDLRFILKSIKNES